MNGKKGENLSPEEQKKRDLRNEKLREKRANAKKGSPERKEKTLIDQGKRLPKNSSKVPMPKVSPPKAEAVVDPVAPARATRVADPKPEKKAAKASRVEGDEEKEATQTLQDIYASMQKEFGVENMMVPAFMSGDDYPQVEWISLDSPKISDLMGRGMPAGRSIELYGAESSGKTSLACYLAGQVQKAGRLAAYVDVEQALDLDYAKSFGLDVDRMLFSQPDSGEKALDIVESLVRKKVGVVVVDSVAMLVPQAEIDGEMGDSHMALQARMMSKACRKITVAQGSSPTIVIWINQTRVNIGQWAPHGQVPTTTSGGNGLKFSASVRIEVKKKELEINAEGEGVSQLIRLKAVKNKVAPPMRVREVRIRFGQGIELTRDWFDYAITYGVIVKRGGGHLFPDGHKEPSGDKAWAYYQKLGEGQDPIISQTRELMRTSKSVPAVMTAESIEKGVMMATRVSDEQVAENEGKEGGDEAAEA